MVGDAQINSSRGRHPPVRHFWAYPSQMTADITPLPRHSAVITSKDEAFRAAYQRKLTDVVATLDAETAIKFLLDVAASDAMLLAKTQPKMANAMLDFDWLDR